MFPGVAVGLGPLDMTETIYFYTKNDPYFELSNFSSRGIEVDGHYWPTIEHYFQAAKFEGTEQYEKIKNAHNPKQAKELGQSRAIPIRRDWDEVKDEIMLFALRKKFSNSKLKTFLLATGSRQLVENSPFDWYWGCGKDGTGKNRLGVLLMQIRDELKNEC